MIKKLFLIRKKDSKSNLLDKTDFKKYVKGEPLEISPKAWDPEAGISHYGFVVELPKLKDLFEFKAWNADPKTVPGLILDLVDAPGSLELALSSVGLHVNPLT